MQASVATDAAIQALESKQFEIEFKTKYDEYRKQVKCYEVNQVKAYALLWERCTKGMKNKIKARSDCDSHIENNPIKLLKAIKEHALNYQESRDAMSIILDAMRTLLSSKQQEGKSLQDYTKRFRVANDVLESHVGGPIQFPKIVEAMPTYDATQQIVVEACNKAAFDQFQAYLYLDNADRTKYGSILTGLNTQKLLGNDQYPKSITEANNVLSNQ